jgi:F0F1-type ATP synthase epsilon subunit
MAAERLHCLVITPERTVVDESADFMAVPLYDGELGVLPGRAPLVGRLGFGELRFAAGRRKYGSISWTAALCRSSATR